MAEILVEVGQVIAGNKNPRDLIRDPEYLEKVLNVSKEYVDLCERYGCEGLWTKKEEPKPCKEEAKTNIKLVDN